MRFILGWALLLSMVVGSGTAWSAERLTPVARKPNFIVIYADDLGYGDLGCYGHPSIRTPNLDRMAAEGLRFTDFYSAAEVCTPSRTALLTGRYAIRSGMAHDQFRVLRANSTGHLPLGEITIAELLKTQGYRTGIIGKWHLGVWSNNPAGHPDQHGFDTTFGLPHSNDMNATSEAPKGAPALAVQKAEWWNAPLYRNRQLIEQPADQTTLTKRYTEEAISFIQRNREQPFFLYLPHTFPHTPLFASGDFRGKSLRGGYGDVVEELDWSVGQVLQTLRTEGLANDTLVIFSSDNGPWLIMNQQGGSAGLLRDGKGSTWEGGMRVPAIAWWPGRIAGGRVEREVASTLDIFPTLARLAGAELPRDRVLDGVDIQQLLLDAGKPSREPFFYYRGTRLFAVRQGDFKAHFLTQNAYGQPKHVVQDPPLLYQLRVDPSEVHNVAAEHSQVVAELLAAAEKHSKTVEPVPSQLVETK
ncbi:MAG: sulfatase [Planctomycetota bacterium]